MTESSTAGRICKRTPELAGRTPRSAPAPSSLQIRAFLLGPGGAWQPPERGGPPRWPPPAGCSDSCSSLWPRAPGGQAPGLPLGGIEGRHYIQFSA